MGSSLTNSESQPEQWFKTPGAFVLNHLRSIRTLGELKVLTALRHFTNSETSLAWPSITKLAEVCGLSRGNVSRAVRSLIKAKLIERVAPGSRAGESTRYRVTDASGSGATQCNGVASWAQLPSVPGATDVASRAHQRSVPGAAQSEEYQTTDQKNDQTRGASDLFDSGSDAEPKPKKKPSGDHQELVAYYCRVWEDLYGDKCQFVGKRDGKHIADVLKAAGLDLQKAIGAVDLYFANRDEFLADKKHALRFLASDFNRYNPRARAIAPAQKGSNGQPKHRGTPDAKPPEFAVTLAG